MAVTKMRSQIGTFKPQLSNIIQQLNQDFHSHCYFALRGTVQTFPPFLGQGQTEHDTQVNINIRQ